MLSETVQTGQEKNARAPFVEIAEDAARMWHWALWSSNGRMMAQNAIPYLKKHQCIAAVKAFLAAAPKVDLIVSAQEKT